MTDAGAWLQLYNGALAAKKDHAEATAAADRGLIAFRQRFPGAGVAIQTEQALQARIAAKIAEAEAKKEGKR